jgi:NDP-sugar pyrophosphorylase family protein
MDAVTDMPKPYSLIREAEHIFTWLCDQDVNLPPIVAEVKNNVIFESEFDRVYFPIPFKETETTAALKGLEGSVACALLGLKTDQNLREIKVNLEKATNFLFQAYVVTVGGLGKFDKDVKTKLKGIRCQPFPTSILQS